MDIRGRLLVVQSEHMFADREAFLYDELLPFLHPYRASSRNASGSHTRGHLTVKDTAGDKVERSGESGETFIVERGSNEAKHQRVQNQKKHKHSSAQLSSALAARLAAFYRSVSLERLLLGLQTSGRARVVPALQDEADRWWPEK
jgi:hypothetical protein